MENLTNNIRSLDVWSRILRLNNQYQNRGLLQVELIPKTSILTFSSNRIKSVIYTITIKYEIQSPVVGFRFKKVHISDNCQKIIVVNDNKVFFEYIFSKIKRWGMEDIGCHVLMILRIKFLSKKSKSQFR